MIYSRWRPAVGGYDYFEAPNQIGLGDDLPVPSLPSGTAIGVASTDIGRPAAPGMRRTGSGATARGSIMPLSRDGLSGITDVVSGVPMWAAVSVCGAGIAAALWVLHKGRKS